MTRKPKETQKEQSKRFIETAKNLGCDESEGALDKAFDRVVKSPQLKSKKSKGGSS